MSVDAMRHYLKGLYNGAYKWVNRVNHMSDEQVMAIYFRVTRSK